jgi:hypothetical protein
VRPASAGRALSVLSVDWLGPIFADRAAREKDVWWLML